MASSLLAFLTDVAKVPLWKNIGYSGPALFELPNAAVQTASHLAQDYVGRPLVDPLAAQLRAAVAQYNPAFAAETDALVASLQTPHSAKLPLMDPYAVAVLCALYVLVVAVFYVLLPSKKPQDKRKGFLPGVVSFITRIHNLGLVLLSTFMVLSVCEQAALAKYRIWGNPVGDTAASWGMAKIVWLFYVSKIWEFVDTLLYMLAGNHRLVSFLHVYHHGTIFPIWWLVTYAAPGGDTYYTVLLNSFIHMLMYTYYMAVSFKFKVPGVFKRCMTLLQMTQFSMMLVQGYYVANVRPNGYPSWLGSVLSIYMISLLFLFGNYLFQDMSRKEAAAARGARAPMASPQYQQGKKKRN